MGVRFERSQAGTRLLSVALVIAVVSGFVLWMGRRDLVPPIPLPLLHTAAYGDDLKEVARLLDMGGDVHERDTASSSNVGGHTALHYAASGKMVELLLARGAKLDARNFEDATPLFTVRTVSAAKALLDAGADLGGHIGTRFLTPLHTIKDRDPGLVAVLVAAGVDVDSRDQIGNSPLHWASKWTGEGGDADVVRELLDHGAKVNAVNHPGQTPLLLEPSDDAISYLLAAGADPNALGPHGTALHAAVRRDGVETAEILLKAGADPNIGGSIISGGALDFTADLEMITLLCKHGASPAVMGVRLERAIELNQEKIAFVLVKSGASPPAYVISSTSGELRIALIDAGFPVKDMPLTGVRDPGALRDLIKLGCDPNSRGKSGPRDLTYALFAAREPEIARLLLDAGADPMPNGADQKTALATLLEEHLISDPSTLADLLDLLLPVTDLTQYDHIAHCRTVAEVEHLLASGAVVNRPEGIGTFIGQIDAEESEAYRISDRLLHEARKDKAGASSALGAVLFESAQHEAAVDLLIRHGVDCDDERVQQTLLFEPKFPSSRIGQLVEMGALLDLPSDQAGVTRSALLDALGFAGGAPRDAVGKGLANARRILALAQAGPDVSVRSRDGRTALHHLGARLLNSRSDEEEAIIVQATAVLVAAGADAAVVDGRDRTAADWCDDPAFLESLRSP